MSDGVDRDAWLDAALRHAPDAELAPPPRLRAEILRQAHAAAQPAGAWLNPLKWLDAIVARPALGAGLAALFVATIVVVAWSPWSAAPVAEVATAAREASSAPLVVAQAPAVATPAPPPAEPPRTAPKAVETRREAAPPRSERAAAKTEVAAATPAPAAPPAARAEEARSAELGRTRVAAGTAADQAGGAAGPAAAATTALAAPADASASALPARARPTDAAPLAAPRRGLRTEPDQWTWQRGGNAPEPVNDALRQWLDKVDAATAGRWEAIDADPPGVRVLATLTLLREERVHTIVRLEADGISRRGSVRLRAPLDPATAATLAAELRQISP